MRKNWLQALGIVIGSTMVLSANSAQAQITPDGTLPNNSNVNLEGNIFNITGGTSAGSNLFHSFKDFSVPTGSTAFFNNSQNIQNILTRVTGGSISNIDGLIKANGTANLFLMNPNGIVFGQNARLDIGGSFVASTASSLKFKDGYEFSATNPQSAPLLTITAPIGLGMSNNPGEIKVNGLGHDIEYNNIKAELRPRVTSSVPGLEVQEGKTLALVGGKVSLEGGILKSPQGRIEIGSVGSNETVSLVPVPKGWKLSYQGITNFEDIRFSKKPFVDTTGNGGGSIAIAGKDINFTGESIILSDTYADRNGGEISVLSDNNITVNESDLSTNTFSSGDAGPITLIAKKSIFLENNGGAGNHTEGIGNAGEITLKADSIVVRNDSGLGSNTYSEGNAGRINVEAKSLRIEQQSGFSTFSQGKGNAGEINITIDGEFVLSNGGGFGSQAYNAGDGGKINITANSFLIENTGFDTNTKSSGNAGEININVKDSFVIRKKSGISSNTSGTGNAGKISILAKNLLVQDSVGISSSTTGQSSKGNGGEIKVDTGSLTIQRDANINTNSSNAGNAGKISVNTNSLLLEENAVIESVAQEDSTGNAGDIDLKANSLTVQNESNINTNSKGDGNAGKISITANSLLVQEFTGIDSKTTGQSSKGNGGEIKVDTGSLTIQNYAGINTSSSNAGNAGKISITAQSLQVQNSAGLGSNTKESSTGNGGEITVNAGSLLVNDAVINSGTEATGSAGNLTIKANSLILENNGSLRVESTGTGNAGILNITADKIRLDKQSFISGSTRSGNGGDLILNVGDLLLLRRGSNISATAGTAQQRGNGGNITINSPNGFIVSVKNENNDIFANAFAGAGGKIQINAKGIFGIQQRSRDELVNRLGNDPVQLNPQNLITSDITAFSQQSPTLSGEIAISNPDRDLSKETFSLPEEVLDVARLINQNVCAGTRSNTSSSFTVTGRGGLPASLNEIFPSEEPLVELLELPDSRNRNEAASQYTQVSERTRISPSSHPQEIVEAQGWVVDKNGDVILVAQAPNATPHDPMFNGVSCSASNN
ncbi:filamentous hemagglutinin N-terminal domain-containing protein [Brasilonema sp. UFV-L1]|uniref:two-partner secretion domain-containing protein n=1 Tax=Brasilonema sp. UFV-L1 TaxID=2234130 RepID=UPI00145CFAA1|nr:filamentous hemagglutinin N-terminal domain-containing protein [Brasilonema sp. UFV-L1]